jgi:hypothetical protein
MPAPGQNADRVDRSRKGGFGKSGAAHGFDGTSPGFGSSSDFSVGFNSDDVSLGGVLARAALGLVSGGPLGAIGGALSGLSDGLSFSGGKPGVVTGKGPGGDEGTGGGPGQTRERIKKNPQTPQTPFAPAASAPASPAALRTAADLQNYLSDLQRIAIGEADAQEALARFGIAPEQSYFQYRESFPEFGDLSGTPGGLAGIIRSLGSMSRTAKSFAEGGRVGESMERRDIQTDVGKFGQMLRDLMLMTDEPTGRQAERLAMAEEAGYVSPAIAQREGALYQPGGLMPRVDRTIEVSPLPPPGMSRERTQRERELARVRPRVDQTIEVSPLPPPGMSRERTQRERELARVRRMSQAERDLMEDVRNEPASSLFDFNDAEDLREQDPAVYNDLILDQGYMNPQNITEAAYPVSEETPEVPASSLFDFNDAEDLEEQDPAVYNDLILGRSKETRKHKCLILFHV